MEKDGPPPGKFVVGDLGDATLAAKIKGEVGEEALGGRGVVLFCFTLRLGPERITAGLCDEC